MNIALLYLEYKKRSLGSQKREPKMDVTGITFKKWMKIFPSRQVIGQKIEEAEHTTNRKNQKKHIPKHIKIQLLNNKSKILEKSEKNKIAYL
jgi:hypothetical protein